MVIPFVASGVEGSPATAGCVREPLEILTCTTLSSEQGRRTPKYTLSLHCAFLATQGVPTLEKMYGI